MGADRTRRDRQLHTERGGAADAGFSLVELLIAVTILAIIVIPLLHLFVTSTRVNVKSRQMLRATTVAQDIMEGLKAYTLDEVRTQFNGQDENGNFVPVAGWHYPEEGFYVLNSELIKGDVCELTALETPRDPATGEPTDPDDEDNEIYYFGIRDLKMQGGEYDALIKLDASTYTKAKAGTVHDNTFNGKFYADVLSVSETGGAETDSSYHEPADLSREASKALRKLIEDQAYPDGNYPDNWEEIWKESASSRYKMLGEIPGLSVTARTLNVSLSLEKSLSGVPELDAEGRKQCMAKVAVQYDCSFDGNSYHMYYGKDGFREGELSDSEIQTMGIPRKFTSGNFYLFYYPDYKASDDKILFKIEDDSLLDADAPGLKSITVMKQIRSTVDAAAGVIAPDLTDTELYGRESAYRPTVRVEGGGSGDLAFRTNIGVNMSKQAKKVDPVTGEVEYEEQLAKEISFGPLNADMITIAGDEVSGEPMNVIYDVEISVYEKGAAAHFGEPGFESSEEVHRLAVITNLDQETP